MREGEGAIGLQELCVGLDPHLADVVACVSCQVAVTLELLLQPHWGRDEGHPSYTRTRTHTHTHTHTHPPSVLKNLSYWQL